MKSRVNSSSRPQSPDKLNQLNNSGKLNRPGKLDGRGKPSKLDRVRLLLFYALIPSLFLSYHPVISLGVSDSMNLELSIPLIILALYSALSLPSLINHFPRRISPLFFLAFVTLTVFWSANPLRTILTAGILACLTISVLTIPELISSQKTKQTIVKIFFTSSLLVCAFCWIQCILDVVGVSSSRSLLCPGCASSSIGFPHPNGFAIEPQFMGNLLLAPAILSLFYLCKKPSWKTALPALFIITTLFLIFSRGAIYAFCLAAAGLAVFEFFKKHRKNTILIVLSVIIPLFTSVISQGIMAAAGPTSDTFKTGVAKSISQLSLGRIELFPEEREALINHAQENPDITDDVIITADTFEGNSTTALFSGYIEESTDQRLELNNYALDLWNDNLATILFGVGLGSAGPRLYQKFPDELGHPKEIVQNQYISTLLETGLVGLILAALMLYGYYKLIRHYVKLTPWLIALVGAYTVTLLFFSGLPNALHIYLLPIVVALLFPRDNLVA